ncbi:hypothetical protein ACHWQZ_G019419 [Mnemiopsis leidyi]
MNKEVTTVLIIMSMVHGIEANNLTRRDTKKWRSDGKCGSRYLLTDGTPAECDPAGENPCCSQSGDCKNDQYSCSCPQFCVDYRIVRRLRESGKDCAITAIQASTSRFMKNVCFDEDAKLPFYKCANSDKSYQAHMAGQFGLLYVTEDCGNDPHGYQVCGFQSENMDKLNSRNTDKSDLLCRGYICVQKQDGFNRYIECADKCENDKRDCKTSQVFDETTIEKYLECNDYCDKPDCKDESSCNGFTYGVRCGNNDFLPAGKVCDGNTDCLDDSDERICVVKNSTERTCKKSMEGNSIAVVPIHNFTRCAVMNTGNMKYCLDYSDQTNCTDKERIGGYCQIDGFDSSVSKFVVCSELGKDKKLCDDKLEDKCFTSRHKDCKIHKHKMCDGVPDCTDGSDEDDEICNDVFGINCTRRFNVNSGVRGEDIPASWIMDNETDCMDGEDENSAQWSDLLCSGKIKQFKSGTTETCQDLFKCPGGNKFVPLKNLCDGVESCGENAENDICTISRDFPHINKSAPYKNNKRDVCKGNRCEL